MAKVLIVDDERSIRDTLAEFAREERHDVFTAGDADAALEILRSESPDAIVTDIILPRVTGVDLLQQIHEEAPDVQVIMITGEPTAETAAEAVRLGAFDYLSKPILRDGFKSALASALRVSALAQRKRELEAQNARYQQHLEEEVEKKTAELRASEEKYRTVIDNANEAVFVAQDDRLRFVNPKTVELIGYPEEETLSMPFSRIIHPEDLEMVVNRYRRRLAGEDPVEQYEFRVVTAAGETAWIEIRPVRIDWEGRPATLNFAIDVTERKRAESALRESEERFRRLFEVSPSAIVYMNLSGHIVLCNDSFARMHGAIGGAEAQIGRRYRDFVPEEELSGARETVERTIAERRSLGSKELILLRDDGTRFPAEVDSAPVFDEEGSPIGLVVMSMDITERKRAEVEERKRQERIRQVNEALLQLATQPALYEGDLDAALDSIVRTAADVLEVEQVGIWMVDPSLTSSASERFYVRSENRYRTSDIQTFDETPIFFEALRKNRVLAIPDITTDPLMNEFDVDKLVGMGISSVLDAAIFVGGELVGDLTFEHVGPGREWTHEDLEFASEAASLVALTVESNQRRQAEDALEQREREYEALFEDSPASLWYEDFSEVKSYLEELRGAGVEDLRSFFRDRPETIEECIRRIRVVAVNEAAVKMHAAKSKDDLLGGIDRILTDVSRTSMGDQLLAIWRGERLYEDTTVDQTFAGELRHVAIRWVVPAGYEETFERVLLAKIDISAVAEAERALRQALDGTIEAIGLTTETRDPYTAGHQQRVTKLAVAIAEEIGLDADRIEGTRAAGLMHDIGKMAIPAEILSKPSRLTDMEMALIQSHPRAAYDILKPVSFPWPLAEIVLQHHERIDGSGYPQGLQGDDILPEARILAVADTVEAMASHRPYRAALGIDVALSEIEEHRGSRYDSEAVDACLRLFREGRFAFEEQEAVSG